MSAAPGWAYHPNGQRLAAIYVSPFDALRLVERGWLTVNGRRAEVLERYEGVNLDGSVALRIIFDEPYPKWGGELMREQERRGREHNCAA